MAMNERGGKMRRRCETVTDANETYIHADHQIFWVGVCFTCRMYMRVSISISNFASFFFKGINSASSRAGANITRHLVFKFSFR